MRLALRSLGARALAFNMAILIVAGASYTALFLREQRKTFDQELLLRAETVTAFTASQCEYPALIAYREELQRIADNALGGGEALYVVITGAQGQVTVSAAKPGAPPIPPPASRGPSWTVTRTHHGHTILELARPIAGPRRGGLFEWESPSGARNDIGQVRIGFSTSREEDLFARTVRWAVIVACVAIVLVAIVQAHLVKRLLQPLRNLIQFTRQIGSGNLRERARAPRDDEVGELTAAFNQMLDRLGATTVSRDYFDNIIRSMGESLIVTDPSDRIQMVNPATLTLVGYTERELLDRPASLVARDGGASAGPLIAIESVYLAKSGREIPVLASIGPMYNENGRLLGVIRIAQDMTWHKQQERELRSAKEAAEEASRAKSAFLANMSHELRTPLNTALGFSQLLEDEIGDYNLPELAADVHVIQVSTRMLISLINNILDFSKIEAGRVELQLEWIDLAEVVRDVAIASEPAAVQKGNRISAHCEPHPFYGDAPRIQQALLNLVNNACKFTENGTIRISLDEETREGRIWRRIDVADTGIGIRPDQIPRLFQSFSQADASVTRKYGGTGLGLAISQKLCQLMGGEITVQSEHGRGSVFSMHLPMVEPPPPDHAEEEGGLWENNQPAS